MLTVRWGSDLGKLADRLFDLLNQLPVTGAEEVFARRDAIVVPNRVQQAWLQLRFLYDRPRGGAFPNVLADCDFPLAGPFINDWLYRMTNEGAREGHPNPEEHPFSVKSLRWRIYAFLMSEDLSGVFEPLAQYVRPAGRSGAAGGADARKGFKLAGRLAALYDEYQTVRPEMMLNWEAGGRAGTDSSTRWEPELWRRLTAGARDRTYLSAFRRLGEDLAKSGLAETYRRLFVFAPSMLPPAQIEFFRRAGCFMDVDVFLLNPARGDWFDRDRLAAPAAGLHDRPEDDAELPDDGRMHPLLAADGRGCRDMVAAAIDLTDGAAGGDEADEDAYFIDPPATSLGELQRSLTAGDDRSQPKKVSASPDGSIQIHACHGKMREVEVLKDLLLRGFAEFPGLQPRDIQVQVSDMTEYASAIEAVFSGVDSNGRSAIPYVLADRVVAGESSAAVAFRQLLALPESRFSTADLLDLLRCETVANRFGFASSDDVDLAAEWLSRAGVRWGRDVFHRQTAADVEKFDAPEATWRFGLDRLLLGYALGDEAAAVRCTPASDCVEGGEALLLGRLARFYESLAEFAATGAKARPVREWADRLDRLVDEFFTNDNKTYLDTGLLKKAIRLLRISAEAAEFEKEVPLAVVRNFLEGHLTAAGSGENPARNKVVFSSLRPGSSTPRRIQVLLGMGDGLFPRSAARPAYDLMRDRRRMGDRHPAIEDRAAFLEALLNARDRLIILYPAFSPRDGEAARESVVVRELREYLDSTAKSGAYAVVTHRLHGFNPAYFDGTNPAIFSYSAGSRRAAEAILAAAEKEMAAQAKAGAASSPSSPPVAARPVRRRPERMAVSLRDLVAYFKNPAQDYFRHVLGIELEDSREARLPDEETTSADGLAVFQLRGQLLNLLATGGEPPVERWMADGLLQLGAPGQKMLDDYRTEVRQWLDQTGPDRRPFGDWVRAELDATPESMGALLDVDGVEVALDGTVRLFDAPSGKEKACAFIRCAKPKAAVRVETWLTFLLAAAAERPVRVFLAELTDDPKKGEFTTRAFDSAAVAPDAAREHLTDLLRIFLTGREVVLPFTTPAALAYLETLRNPGKAASPEKAKAAAMKAAQEAWSGHSSRFDGVDDPYLKRAFGDGSPLDDREGFIALAERLCGPMLDAQKIIGIGDAAP